MFHVSFTPSPPPPPSAPIHRSRPALQRVGLLGRHFVEHCRRARVSALSARRARSDTRKVLSHLQPMVRWRLLWPMSFVASIVFRLAVCNSYIMFCLLSVCFLVLCRLGSRGPPGSGPTMCNCAKSPTRRSRPASRCGSRRPTIRTVGSPS
jgi:hypothetical protein